MEKPILIGIDSGNTESKVSYLNREGNIDSFSIPTVIAKAPDHAVEGDTYQSSEESLLHIEIDSPALPNKHKHWYVGEYAKNKEKKEETKGDKKLNNPTHIITAIASLAVVALKSGKDNIKSCLSIGLPIDEFKEIGQEALEKFKAKHTVTFIDGRFKDKKVEVDIVDGIVNAEGSISSLALRYDIKENKLKKTELHDKIPNEYAISDLGSVTVDHAFFGVNGLDKDSSVSDTDLGTNKFIDELIEEVNNHSEFDEVRKNANENDKAYNTRTHFMKEVIYPAIEKYIKDESVELKFKAKWAYVRNVDVTDIVKKHMKEYGEQNKSDLLKRWAKSSVDEYYVIGGGLLFGYIVLKELKGKYSFTFPPNIMDAPYLNSRAYLISNFLEQAKKEKLKSQQQESIEA